MCNSQGSRSREDLMPTTWSWVGVILHLLYRFRRDLLLLNSSIGPFLLFSTRHIHGSTLGLTLVNYFLVFKANLVMTMITFVGSSCKGESREWCSFHFVPHFDECSPGVGRSFNWGTARNICYSNCCWFELAVKRPNPSHVATLIWNYCFLIMSPLHVLEVGLLHIPIYLWI
jgi:hypothetical protein